ncbi:MAG: hypothetical protein OEM82_15980 [Acidobacteriota bacterium]|nr:hypothetical protein [Acidobacteriota bacterium]
MTKEQAGQNNLMFVIAIVVPVVAVFFQSFGGDFVYDDNRQILRNPLIQDPEL